MAVIQIGGKDIPDPSALQWDQSDITSDSSGRNAAGAMLMDRIAQKVKLTLSWNFLTFDKISAILSAIEPIYFDVTYPDPKDGFTTTKTFYLGDRSTPLYSVCDGIAGWQSLSITLNEK